MKRRIDRRHVWPLGVAACVAMLACVVLAGPLTQTMPAALPTNQVDTNPDVNLIYENHEPVGWVFGRVVGFEGADKPLLPRQTLPAPNLTMLRRSVSP